MKLMIVALTVFSSSASFADDTAAKLLTVLSEPAVVQAIDAVVNEPSADGRTTWFKGAVRSETPSSCTGDRETFVLLYGRTIQQNGSAVTQKCSQLVHFGDCKTVTGKLGDVEAAPRCKNSK